MVHTRDGGGIFTPPERNGPAWHAAPRPARVVVFFSCDDRFRLILLSLFSFSSLFLSVRFVYVYVPSGCRFFSWRAFFSAPRLAGAGLRMETFLQTCCLCFELCCGGLLFVVRHRHRQAGRGFWRPRDVFSFLLRSRAGVTRESLRGARTPPLQTTPFHSSLGTWRVVSWIRCKWAANMLVFSIAYYCCL